MHESSPESRGWMSLACDDSLLVTRQLSEQDCRENTGFVFFNDYTTNLKKYVSPIQIVFYLIGAWTGLTVRSHLTLV